MERVRLKSMAAATESAMLVTRLSLRQMCRLVAADAESARDSAIEPLVLALAL